MPQDGYLWLCQHIVDHAPDAIVFVNLKGDIRLWNPRAEAVFGYTSAEAIGQSLDFLMPEKVRPCYWAGFRQAIDTGVTQYDPHLRVVPAVHKDGRRLTLEITVDLTRHPNGMLLGGVAIIRDVTPLTTRPTGLRQEPHMQHGRVVSV